MVPAGSAESAGDVTTPPASAAALAGAASVATTSAEEPARPGTVTNRCSNERNAGASGPAAGDDGYGTNDWANLNTWLCSGWSGDEMDSGRLSDWTTVVLGNAGSCGYCDGPAVEEPPWTR